ncbi:MAG: hypothetical protein J6T51_03840 [Kiritimatiellae bacterium]|nr:hypothetical protein [Kiritimatiellia bacterium]
MNEKTSEKTAPAAPERQPGAYRPQLALYHPNGKGTGGAAKFELHPAHDDTEGSVMLRIANQSAIGGQAGGVQQFARFDWENAITVKLGFADLCAFLQVFNGECESLGDGRGLYHRTARAATKILLRHLVDPRPCYSLELYRTAAGGGEAKAHMLMSCAEAEGLRAAILGSMSVVCFGIPVVIPRDTSAYRAENSRRAPATGPQGAAW